MRKSFSLLGVFVFACASCVFVVTAAEAAPVEIRVRDIGVVGLFSHDVFAWDHRNKVNTENGVLDLSTIFDYDEGRLWQSGGNPKNSDNPPVYSVTLELVEYYNTQIHDGVDFDQARKNTVLLFHKMVGETYGRLRQQPLPEFALRGFVTDIEQAAFRGLHDVLPGKIPLKNRLMRSEITITSPMAKRFPLTEEELNSTVPTFDGQYAKEFREIKIPFTDIVLNLQDIDRKFIESHSNFKQAEMLNVLAAYGRGEIQANDIFFIEHVDRLFAKALCSEGNQWMPHRECR